MRYALTASLLLTLAAPALLAQGAEPAAATAEAPSKATKRTVYLNSTVLEELKDSNPGHYAEARRIMAAASLACSGDNARLWQVAEPGPAARAPRYLAIPNGCSSAFVKTSNPPKREISFQIDDTTYVALVTLRNVRPSIQHAHPDEFKVAPPRFHPLDR